MNQDAQTHREHGDLDLVRIVLVGLIGAASLLVLVEGTRAWVYYMKADEIHGKVVTPVDQELAEHHAREQAKLDRYRLIDEQTQTVAIPIDEAIRLYVQQQSGQNADSGGDVNQ